MVFDFLKKRAEEGFAQVQNIATKTLQGKMMEGLSDSAEYVRMRQSIDTENIKKLTDGAVVILLSHPRRTVDSNAAFTFTFLNRIGALKREATQRDKFCIQSTEWRCTTATRIIGKHASSSRHRLAFAILIPNTLILGYEHTGFFHCAHRGRYHFGDNRGPACICQVF